MVKHYTTVGGVDITGKKKRKIAPLPEVLERGGKNETPWTVEEIVPGGPLGGGVMMQERRLLVPLDEEQIAENIRAHELAHIQWSKKYPKDIPFMVMNSAEDMRINTKLVEEAGVDISQQGLLNELYLGRNIGHFKELDKFPDDLGPVVTTMLTNYPTQQFNTLYGVLDQEYKAREAALKGSGAIFKQAMAIVDRAVEYINRAPRPLSWDTSVNIARYVAQILAEPPEVTKDSMQKANKPMAGQPISKEELMKARGMAPAPQEGEGKEKSEGGGEGKGEGKGEEKDGEKGEDGKSDTGSEGEGEASGEEGEGSAEGSESYDPSGEAGEMSEEFAQGTSPSMANGYFFPWGPLTIEPPRTRIPLPGSFFGKQWKPTGMGVLPKFMNRWAADKEIWGHKKRVKGGTVLIDGSGSMRLQKADVFDVMKAAPGAEVAIYSGDGRKGVLRILVQKNKRVDDNLIGPPGGGDNTVDGPALRWLLKQKGPRVWISDGKVVGVGGQGPGNLAEADLLCKRGRVMRVTTCAEAVEVFQRLNAR